MSVLARPTGFRPASLSHIRSFEVSHLYSEVVRARLLAFASPEQAGFDGALGNTDGLRDLLVALALEV